MPEHSATVTVALSGDNQPNRSYDIVIASHSLKNLGAKLVEIGLFTSTMARRYKLL